MIENLELCPGRWRLTRSLPPPPSSPEAERGERIHQLLAMTAACKAWPENVAPDEAGEAEACWLMLTELVRSLGFGRLEDKRVLNIEKRLYSSGGRWSGKPDLVLQLDDETCMVVDYKTGRFNVTEAAYNLQLQALAVLAGREYGAASVLVAVVAPRNDNKQTVARYNADLLDKAAERIERIVEAAMREDAPLRAGEQQCRFCPAAAHCPELAGRVVEPVCKAVGEKQTTTLSKAAAVKAAELMPLERAVELWRARRLYQGFFDALEKRIKGLDDNTLAGLGLKRVPGRLRREVNDINELFRRLKERGGINSQQFVELCTVSLPGLEKLLAACLSVSEARARQFLVEVCGDLIAETRGADQIVEAEPNNEKGEQP